MFQAESVQDAATNMDTIGRDIADISNNVEALNDASISMKSNCDNSMAALNALIQQSGDVRKSVNEIGQTIESTNESAQQISARYHIGEYVPEL